MTQPLANGVSCANTYQPVTLAWAFGRVLYCSTEHHRGNEVEGNKAPSAVESEKKRRSAYRVLNSKQTQSGGDGPG